MRPASTDTLPPGVPSSMLACVRVMVTPTAVYCFARLMPAPSNVSRLPSRGQVQIRRLPHERSAAACRTGVVSSRAKHG